MADKIYIAMRDAKGRVRSYDPANMPADAPEAAHRAAAAILGRDTVPAQPKGKRGRPAGYKCSPETVAKMVASRQATLAAKRADMSVN